MCAFEGKHAGMQVLIERMPQLTAAGTGGPLGHAKWRAYKWRSTTIEEDKPLRAYHGVGVLTQVCIALRKGICAVEQEE